MVAHMRLPASALLAAMAVALCSAAVTDARAQPTEQRASSYALSLLHVSSDNLSRASDGERGVYSALGLQLDLRREQKRFQGGMAGNLEYRSYDEKAGLPDERVGAIDAFANVDIVPSRFRWFFDDAYGQVRTDVFEAEGPLNREAINVFSTGPELTVPFARRLALSMRSTYSDRKHEETDTVDVESLGHEIRVYRQMNSTSRIGIGGARTEFEYANELPGFEIESVSIRYERQLATGNVAAEIGQNRVIDDTSDSASALVRFEWRRAVARRSLVSFTAGREFMVAGDLFQLAEGQVAIDRTTDILLTSSPMVVEHFTASHSLQFSRTTVSTNIALIEQRFNYNEPFNNDSTTLQFDLRRNLSNRNTAGISLERARRNFFVVRRDEEDTVVRLSFDRRLSQHFRLGVSGEESKRDAESSFRERLYQLRLTFNPKGGELF